MTEDLRRSMPPALRFDADEANRASQAWGFNCGPAALAAMTGRAPDDVRPFIGDFEARGYTNPTLMFAALNRMGIGVRQGSGNIACWPNNGLVRIQWHGPWMKPGVPIAARYRLTHWVGARRAGDGWDIFDVNCMCIGGWVTEKTWADKVVPWLLRECVPRHDGGWSRTHVIELPTCDGGGYRETQP